MTRNALVRFAPVPALAALLLAVACAQPAPEAPAPAPTPAAAPTNAPQASAEPASQKAYVCEMGCEVVEAPGKCSKCGMDLMEVDRSQISYECGVCGYKADKPGVCPKDNIVLNFKLAEKAP